MLHKAGVHNPMQAPRAQSIIPLVITPATVTVSGEISPLSARVRIATTDTTRTAPTAAYSVL